MEELTDKKKKIGKLMETVVTKYEKGDPTR